MRSNSRGLDAVRHEDPSPLCSSSRCNTSERLLTSGSSQAVLLHLHHACLHYLKSILWRSLRQSKKYRCVGTAHFYKEGKPVVLPVSMRQKNSLRRWTMPYSIRQASARPSGHQWTTPSQPDGHFFATVPHRGLQHGRRKSGVIHGGIWSTSTWYAAGETN